MKDNGLLGFITPYTLLKNQYYIEARKFILTNTSIKSLIDFTGAKVFADATVDSIVLILMDSLSFSFSLSKSASLINKQFIFSLSGNS